MKRFMLCLLMVALGLSLMLSVQGCGGKSVVGPQTTFVSGTVYDQGVLTKDATVMICFPGDSTLMISPELNGSFKVEIPNDLIVKSVVAVTLGKSGMTEVNGLLTNLRIDMVPLVDQAKAVVGNVNGEYWFGAYSTDVNGDVKFRYQYSFIGFRCVNYLPWILWFNGWQNPDPNSWLSWNVTFPSPWKGKFLAVPRRLQDWHNIAYGYPIQRALYLIAIG